MSRLDESKVPLFMERYSTTVTDAGTEKEPDAIVKIAYGHFVREPLRTFARDEVQRRNGLEVKDSLIPIGDAVLSRIRAYSAESPFILTSVVVGNVQYPEEVANAVARKLAATQELQRKDTEIEIFLPHLHGRRPQSDESNGATLEGSRRCSVIRLSQIFVRQPLALTIQFAEDNGHVHLLPTAGTPISRSSSTQTPHMSDIEQRIENLDPGAPGLPVPVREGLPPAYRMRADSHYVEQLESVPTMSSVKLVDARTIDVRGEDPRPTTDFVESIKRHGVLQPLLVQTRGGRYRLIAGRKRLTAAIAAGLREVPCLVQRVDEDQAHALAEATNVPSLDASVLSAPPTSPSGVDPAAEALAQSLSALASSANLLTGGSSLALTVASGLVRAEASRALQLLLASRVLRGDVAMARIRVPVRTILDRALQITAAERHLRSADVRLNDGTRDAFVRGDEELLTGAVASLMMATVALVGDLRGPVVLASSIRPDGRVVMSVSQESLTVPEAWVAQTFESSWPIATATGSSLLLIQSARRIAEAHGGQALAANTEIGTSFSIVLPVALREM